MTVADETLLILPGPDGRVLTLRRQCYILSQQPFSSTKYIAAELRTSRDLVKKTVVEVLRMKKFSLRRVPHELTVAQKRQRVAELLLSVL
jgi:hypothetical protein